MKEAIAADLNLSNNERKVQMNGMILALASALSAQFSTSSAVTPTRLLLMMWVHRDFYSFILVHQFSILNGVMPEIISTYCPLREGDDNFT